MLRNCSTSCSQYVAHLFQLQHCQKTGNETKRRLEEAQLDLDKAHTENSLLKEVPNLLAIPLHLAVVAVWRLAWLISDPEIAGSIPVFRAFFLVDSMDCEKTSRSRGAEAGKKWLRWG